MTAPICSKNIGAIGFDINMLTATKRLVKMKKYLLVLPILLLTYKIVNSQSNVYHPFPDTNAIWIGTSWYNVGGTGPCLVTNDYNLYISGDTIIGIYSYHKLYRNGYNSSSMCPQPGYYYYGIYAGAFRQDNANKKIYLFENGTDTLAYNFNLNVGDTLPWTCLSIGYNNYIQSIDSVLIESQYHKRFWLNNNYAALIEGVGSSLGAFARIAPAFESGEDLWCLKINNQTTWTSLNVNRCGLTSITENSIAENQILISQNPFSTETTLNSISDLKNATLTVYNSSGQQAKQMKTISGQTIIFHRDNLPNGLYFIRLTQENKVKMTSKLVIID